MGIAYRTYDQFVRDIADNLYKVPRNIDLVLAIPRSGLIPATMISQYLNINTMVVQRFCELVEAGKDIKTEFYHGRRPCDDKREIKNVLVVDDTIYNGSSKLKWKERFNQDCYKDYKFTFLAVYEEGFSDYFKCDITLKDIKWSSYLSDLHMCLYEWNIFSHGNTMSSFAFDIDGVVCIDPPDERNTEEYIKYIKNPIPYHIPEVTQAKTTFITYRLNKYRPETSEFLGRMGLAGCQLYMNSATSYEERAKVPPYLYKAQVYGSLEHLKLFIESNDDEAKLIAQISGKPVYCVESNRIYDK